MRTHALKPSPIIPTIDLDAGGVQHGYLRVPHSRDDSAWGSLMIPITSIRNGTGPTALLTGGNHGDEYEGPIALFDLARALSAETVRGGVIIVPTMNHPACRAGTRTSPIDGGNMNRSFPGRPEGTVTEKIADFFVRELLPRAEIVLDLHSGGRSLDFLPFAAAHSVSDKRQESLAFESVEAFGAPYCMKMREIDAAGMYDTAAEEMGKVFITTELGGGGTARAVTVAIAKRGVMNVLRQAGIVTGRVDRPARPPQWLDMPSADCFEFSEEDGLLEMMQDLGDPIEPGVIIARIWPIARTGVAPVELRAKASGILAGRHFPGLVKVGDCIAVIATVRSGRTGIG